jgi:DNA topoisomerase-6 subunit B
MTSQQMELGAETGVAEELAAGQRSISIAEFFERNKHMLGFDSEARAIVTAVKEGVDNALDAAEEAGILPDIYVEIEEAGDYYRLVIEDNGPGIPAENVPKVYGKMLYGSRFHVREQNRGQQGIGISAAVLYAQLTSGKPAKITSKPKGGEARYFELTVDTDANEPEVDVERETTWEPPHGTRIELEMEANMRARQQLHAYVQQTAVVNPHARIEFKEPDAHMKFERATDQLPAETEEIRPHPHGVELGTLIKMLEATESYSISGFLQGEFTRVGKKTADSLVRAFKDRHYGRELSWEPPQTHEPADPGDAVREAVANKGQEATDRFVEYVLDGGDGFEGLRERERVARSEVDALVAAAAAAAEADTGRTFGETVRTKAAAALWRAVVGGDGAVGDPERLTPQLYALVDDTTTSRKDDAAVEALARRIATRIADAGDDRHRFSRDALAGHVTWAAERTAEREEESFGETSREKIVDALWETARTVPDDPPKVRTVADDRDAASELLEAMRATTILAPPTDCLAPITAELVEEGLRKEYDADFYAAATRDAEVHGGDPFIVEAGIAYGGDLPDEGQVELLRFANRVPLVYQRGACATVDVVKGINWRNYGLDQPGGSGMPGGPAVIMVHVASTNVPFTSESKDAVANVPEIEDEVELALREAARELKSYLNQQRSLEKRRRKENVIAEILPRMAEKLEEVTGREPLAIEDSLARIMNNVLIERKREGEEVQLVVHNFTDRTADLDVTDIVSVEPDSPGARGDGAEPTVVEMDGEYFVKWSPSIPSGERAVLSYSAADATFDVSVDGVEGEKLTVDA